MLCQIQFLAPSALSFLLLSSIIWAAALRSLLSQPWCKLQREILMRGAEVGRSHWRRGLHQNRLLVSKGTCRPGSDPRARFNRTLQRYRQLRSSRHFHHRHSGKLLSAYYEDTRGRNRRGDAREMDSVSRDHSSGLESLSRLQHSVWNSESSSLHQRSQSRQSCQHRHKRYGSERNERNSWRETVGLVICGGSGANKWDSWPFKCNKTFTLESRR